MTNTNIQGLVSQKDTLLGTPALHAHHSHAFEECVMMQCQEYKGVVEPGATERLLNEHGHPAVRIEF